MAERHIEEVLLARDEIVAAPVLDLWQDYTFELPRGIYIATAVLFVGFVSVLSLAFANPEMAVPWGVIVAFIAAFFVVPSVMVRSAPEGCARSASWSEFMEKGVMTATGKESGLSATVLVLLLPAAILAWGVAIAGVVAFLV